MDAAPMKAVAGFGTTIRIVRTNIFDKLSTLAFFGWTTAWVDFFTLLVDLVAYLFEYYLLGCLPKRNLHVLVGLGRSLEHKRQIFVLHELLRLLQSHLTSN